ncbi:MAG TPA: DUF805 domain-containing protein [Chiayiivirga sp.]|nr:DUF805 domain-containing protein [Chiayiivirga sp.]
MDWGKFFFSFQGRISRKAFWLYLLASIILGFILNFLAMPAQPVIDASTSPEQAMAAVSGYYGAIPIWYWLLQVVLLWVGLAVMAKRWHDQDRSGWWTLLLLIPLLGFIVVLIMLGFIAGTPGPNRFGDGPMA